MRTLLKTLKINKTYYEGIEKGIKSSLTISGIIKVNSMIDDEKTKDERKF